MVKPYTCALDSETDRKLRLYLYKNVNNVETIRKNIVEGTWKCAIIKPSLVLDPFQVAVAANKAAVAANSGSMVTKSIYAEILYNLSLTKNISQSLSRFGIEEGHEMLVCVLTDSDEVVLTHIDGDLLPIDQLPYFSDVKEIKNVYKLNNVTEQSNEQLLDLIVSRIVTKNFVSF